MSEKVIYRCNICYSYYIYLFLVKKGCLLNSCGCFYCIDCYKTSRSYINIEKNMCYGCGKSIDFSKVIDITNKESLKKIEFIYDEPEIQLKKIVDCIKFQNLHQKKYIDFLEKKIEQLSKENQKLKENIVNGRVDNLNNISIDKIKPTSSTANNASAFLDLKQIKKIEPKRNERASNKVINKTAAENIKTDNLNAKTAEIMKTSPGLGNNFQNSLLHTNINQHKTLINVNINNSNKILKDDMSNYEKNLFKQQVNSVNMTENKHDNINNNSLNSSLIYHNQKRKYNQLMNNNEDYSNVDKNFQTPLQNLHNINPQATPLNQMNKIKDINELIKTKKFKYH